MKKWWILGIVIIILIVAVASLNTIIFNQPKINYSCAEDSECVLVQTSCCSCLQIQDEIKAINKQSEVAWNENLACGITLCEQCQNSEPAFVASCVSGKCKAVVK